ncbi:MAG TPA: aminotransferase class IV [Polyangiaceae bacterium]|nr:aminotransferase class IV [Polyangiaceae bacterium]
MNPSSPQLSTPAIASSSSPRAMVSLDGILHDAAGAQVSVFDRGFLYGDSVFETLRTYFGRPYALQEHLQRLENSAKRVLIPMPVPRDVWCREIEQTIAAAGFSESYVRVMLTRGRGEQLGLDPALARQPLRLVLVLPLEAPVAHKYERGIGAIIYRTQRVADGTDAAGAKLGNYLTAVLATHAARLAQAEEALLVDREDQVLEGATSNVFGVASGHLITAPEECGILAGITRARILAVAHQLGLPVVMRPLRVAELATLNELFISSSIREIFPVVSVDGDPIRDGHPGPITRELLGAFRARARAEVRGEPVEAEPEA